MTPQRAPYLLSLVFALAFAGCAEPPTTSSDSGPGPMDAALGDSGWRDSGSDSGASDSGASDSGLSDSGEPIVEDAGTDAGMEEDAGNADDAAMPVDAGGDMDSGTDAATPRDAGTDTGVDAAMPRDAGTDTGTDAATPRDAGSAIDTGIDVGPLPPGACLANSDCTPTQFCSRPDGMCDAVGTCATRPMICAPIFFPVCGCNGSEYDNDCNARSAGTSVRSYGSCR